MIARSNVFLISMLCAIACGTQSTSKLDIIGGQKEPSDKGTKGSYPSTIGLSGTGSANGPGSCTGSRLSQATFITAAHCLNKASLGSEIVLFASNSRKFSAFIKKIQIHSSWVEVISGGTSLGSDVALFEVAFATREDKSIFDGFVTTVPMAFGTFPEKDLPIILAGFGCEQKKGLFPDDCLKQTNFEYMKSAKNKVYDPPRTLLGTLAREFQVDASTNKDGMNGFTSSGDSGGPVLTLDGRLIGITSSSSVPFYTENDGWAGHTNYTWLEYPDVKTWITEALATESKADSYQSSSHAVIEFMNGDKYLGAVSNGFRNGQGTMFYHDGKSYQGNWLLNVRSGYGEQTWPEGSKYISYKGQWRNDLPNGLGTMVYPTGQIYVGQLVDAKLQGSGQMTYANGDVRKGSFVNNKREGEFILITADGRTYREQFTGDNRTAVEQIN